MDRAPDLVLDFADVPVPVPLAHWQLNLAQLVKTAFDASPKGFPVRLTRRLEGQAYPLSVDCTDGARPPAGPAAGHSDASSLHFPGPGMDIVRRVTALSSSELKVLPPARGTTIHFTVQEGPRK